MAQFKVFCADCGTRYQNGFVARPLVCRNCGSDFIATKEIAEEISEDVVARVRKLRKDGFTVPNLALAFQLEQSTIDDIIAGKHGEGKLSPHYVGVSDRVSAWIEEMRRKKVIP